MNYSIGITTYSKRLESLLLLVDSIRKLSPRTEIILAINGDINSPFNDSYRSQILLLCGKYKNIYPIFFTEFRCLSKLWNTLLIHSSNNGVFVTQDDVSIVAPSFFMELEEHIENQNERSFKLNNSWSHVFLNKKEVNEVNWFDEGFLALGEEDGDFEWRYLKKYGGENFKNIQISSISHDGEDKCLEGENLIRGRNSNTFNRDVLLNKKYIEHEGGEQRGIIDKKLSLKHPHPNLYPYEKFFQENKSNIFSTL